MAKNQFRQPKPNEKRGNPRYAKALARAAETEDRQRRVDRTERRAVQ